MTAQDVLIAPNKLGFHNYIGLLFIYLNSFQEFRGEQGDHDQLLPYYHKGRSMLDL